MSIQRSPEMVKCQADSSDTPNYFLPGAGDLGRCELAELH